VDGRFDKGHRGWINVREFFAGLFRGSDEGFDGELFGDGGDVNLEAFRRAFNGGIVGNLLERSWGRSRNFFLDEATSQQD
jgi:hypothetical protein